MMLPASPKPRTRIARIANAYDIYIGRPGKGLDGIWGNICGQASPCPMCAHVHEYAKTSLPCYVQLISTQLSNVAFSAAIHNLAGKTLGCWCERSTPCHGDVLAFVADALEREWTILQIQTELKRWTLAQWITRREIALEIGNL